jgi:hypothetical protein
VGSADSLMILAGLLDIRDHADCESCRRVAADAHARLEALEEIRQRAERCAEKLRTEAELVARPGQMYRLNALADILWPEDTSSGG